MSLFPIRRNEKLAVWTFCTAKAAEPSSPVWLWPFVALSTLYVQPQQRHRSPTQPKMASSLSSLSTILSQPHCAVRIKFPKHYSSFHVRFLSSKLLQLQSSSCRRTSAALRRSSTFSLKISRNFSNCQSRTSLPSKDQIPSLHQFIPKATAPTVSASDVQSE